MTTQTFPAEALTGLLLLPQGLTASQALAGLLFLGFVAITLAGAVVATGARRLVRSVAGLALCFLGVAGLYYYLASPFVALMQILIYIGAVCVTIIFAVMLAETADQEREIKRKPVMAFLGVAGSAAVTAALAWVSLGTKWTGAQAAPEAGSLEKVGQSLLTTYSMSFELISVVLLVAIVGSLVLARAGRDK